VLPSFVPGILLSRARLWFSWRLRNQCA